MQKILIVINSMSVGGIQKALLNLLKELSKKTQYDITLLLINEKGDYLEEIPANIKVECANQWWSLLETSNREAKERGTKYWLARSFLALLIKLGRRDLATTLLAMTQKKYREYDVAISYRQPDIETNVIGGTAEFVRKCCYADKKVIFIHCDYSLYGGNCRYNTKQLEQFDRVAVVSNGCIQKLLQCVPQIRSKVTCVYNCQDYEDIRKKAEDNSVVYRKNRPIIVSVSRLGAEKGIDRAIVALEKLKKSGMNFEWHIIGDGEEREKLKKLSEDQGMTDCIYFEGGTTNPYRYMKNADIFFLPSYHEAAPMVIGEAICIGIPVLATNTSSAYEFVGTHGMVCDNTAEGIEYGLKTMLCQHPDNYRMYYAANEKKLSNDEALQQFTEVCK